MKKVKETKKKKMERIDAVENNVQILKDFNEKRMQEAIEKASTPQPFFIPTPNGYNTMVPNSPVEFSAILKAFAPEDSSLATESAMFKMMDHRATYTRSVYEYIYNNTQNAAMANDLAEYISDDLYEGEAAESKLFHLQTMISENTVKQFNNRVRSLVRPILLTFIEWLEKDAFHNFDKAVITDDNYIKTNYSLSTEEDRPIDYNIMRGISYEIFIQENGLKFEGLVELISKVICEHSAPTFSDVEAIRFALDPYYIMFQNVQLPTILTIINDFLEEIIVNRCNRYDIISPANLYNLAMSTVASYIIELKTPFCGLYLQLRSECFMYYHSVFPGRVSQEINELKYGSKEGPGNYMTSYFENYPKESQELIERLEAFDTKEVFNLLMEDDD